MVKITQRLSVPSLHINKLSGPHMRRFGFISLFPFEGSSLGGVHRFEATKNKNTQTSKETWKHTILSTVTISV